MTTRSEETTLLTVVCMTTVAYSTRKRLSPAASHSTTATNNITVIDNSSATPRFRPFWEGFSSSVKIPPIEMSVANTSVSLARYSYRGHAQILSNVRRSRGKTFFMHDYPRYHLV